jgi:TolB-like protein
MSDRADVPLDPADWQRAREILADLLDQPPGGRAAALDAACAGKPGLRAEIESLLRAHSRADGFLDTLDTGAAAALIEAAGDDLEVDDVVGPYRIAGRLGRGGMGVVHRAVDTRLGRAVALKVLPWQLSRNEHARQRLIDEARAAAALNHPNIGVIHEIGETDSGRTYIAMACYEGRTLRDLIGDGPMPPARAVPVARQIAAGLAAAHAGGITHRDIKPSNVMVSADGATRIVDFGIAIVAGAGPADGVNAATIPYMSPEQSRADGTVGHATDVWSLGVVIHEMLMGERPFRGGSDTDLIRAIRNGDAAPLTGVPAALRTLLERCLARDPEARPTAAALTERLREVEASIRPRPGAGTRTLVATLVVLLLAVWIFVRSGGDPAVAGAEASIAVLPFVPVSPDTSLDRTGRDLVVTLSSTLREAGGLPMVDASTVLARLDSGRAANSHDDWLERARQLGAHRIVHGTLLLAGGTLRVDAALSEIGGTQVAHVSATAAPHDLGALSDSLTSALLRQVWRREARTLPDQSSLTTRPLPALRAYLEGEQALARSDYVTATAAFERALRADTSFWFAYWRSLYPRVREGVPPADSAAMRQVFERRATFPRADRLLLDSRLAPDRRTRQSLLNEVTRDFPHYWPGWFDHANHLIHFGPFDGSSYDQARAALERVVELNPGFIPAWDHLFWIAVIQRDTSLARVTRGRGGVSPMEPVYRALHEILLAGGQLPDSTARRIEAIAGRASAPGTLEQAATGFLPFGFFEAQVEYAELVANRVAVPAIAAEYRWGRAAGWAARGAWDSAFVDLDRAVRITPGERMSGRAYGLAVLGAVLGSIDVDTAARRRPDFDRLLDDPPSAEVVAQRAWLDGVLGALRREPAAVAAATRGVVASGSAHRSMLEQSLAALGRYARGDTAGAAASLADLEARNADRALHLRFGADHPFVPAIHRMLASDWLIASGDTAAAAHLLTWHEAILWSEFYPVEVANRVAEPIALLRRARIEEAFQRHGPARVHYLAFLDRYDSPPRAHAAWSAEAVEALGRVSADPDRRLDPGGPSTGK